MKIALGNARVLISILIAGPSPIWRGRILRVLVSYHLLIQLSIATLHTTTDETGETFLVAQCSEVKRGLCYQNAHPSFTLQGEHKKVAPYDFC